MSEAQIIKQCLRGDPKGQRMLFEAHYDQIYSTVFRYLRNHHDTEDVVSEVFNRIFKNIKNFKSKGANSFKAWIKTISINEALRFSKNKLPINYTEEFSEIPTRHLENVNSIDTIDIERIKKIVEEMPEGYRTIFLLNVVEGLSHSEIAQHLGISRNTSKSQMLKARKYIQSKMKKDESRSVR